MLDSTSPNPSENQKQRPDIGCSNQSQLWSPNSQSLWHSHKALSTLLKMKIGIAAGNQIHAATNRALNLATAIVLKIQEHPKTMVFTCFLWCKTIRGQNQHSGNVMIYMLIKSLRIYALPSITIQNYIVLYWIFPEYLSLTTCVDSLELATASQLAPYCPSLQKPPGSNVGHLAPRNRKGGNGDESARQIGCKERWWYMVMNGVTVWSTYN